ncbi:sensor histidine kinase [Paenibacillus sp. IHBB 10380]|uniref:sensor histidine kinase n=1 Tax=Paenibacillus sp. IHBB 10380 TaxID=1566358 RepID=UPI000696A899|nr:histidine kinase [Paenibacillus sp. IHBB 10380]
MSTQLNMLRYSLIVIPACLSIYIYSYDNYGIYTLYILLYLNLAVLDRFVHYPPIKRLFFIVEMLFSTWLCTRYGNLILFISLSSLCSYITMSGRMLRFVMLGLHLLLLNIALGFEQPEWTFCLNAIFVITSILLLQLQDTVDSREEIVQLYDELRKKYYELDEKRSQLIQFNHQVEAAAQSGERNRISRQLHDDIGHRLIRVKMMMEAAIHTLPTDSARGMELMLQIRDQVAASMDDMRNTVKQMRPATSLAEEYALDRLLENTGRETGIHTSLLYEGVPFTLYPSSQIVFYKNAQEALTNALRHGHATSVKILVVYGDREVSMAVSNNGEITAAHSTSQRQQGMGLSGMQERSKLMGGDIHIQWEYPFTIVTKLPIYRNHGIL